MGGNVVTIETEIENKQIDTLLQVLSFFITKMDGKKRLGTIWEVGILTLLRWLSKHNLIPWLNCSSLDVNHTLWNGTCSDIESYWPSPHVGTCEEVKKVWVKVPNTSRSFTVYT